MPDDYIAGLAGHFHYAHRDTADDSAFHHEASHPIDLIIA